MSRPCHRHPSPHLHVVAEGVPDRDIIALWHDAETGEAADRIVDDVMAAVDAELSAIDLADAAPTGVEAAIVRATLRSGVVAALRRNLIRRIVAARESAELPAGKTGRQRFGHVDPEPAS